MLRSLPAPPEAGRPPDHRPGDHQQRDLGEVVEDSRWWIVNKIYTVERRGG